MCGRFTLKTETASLAEQFGGAPPPDLPMRYNIAPTQPVAIIRIGSTPGTRHWQMVRWGLIPSWSKDAAIGNRLINARAETVAEKPAFRNAFRRRRCLVPADGYFEWHKSGRTKQPYYIRMNDERPFALAGLWETWENPESGKPLESCTVITTAANERTRRIHDRMPVILAAADHGTWLDPQCQDAETLCALLRPFAGSEMVADPVDTHVNNPRNDDPRCVALLGGHTAP